MTTSGLLSTNGGLDGPSIYSCLSLHFNCALHRPFPAERRANIQIQRPCQWRVPSGGHTQRHCDAHSIGVALRQLGDSSHAPQGDEQGGCSCVQGRWAGRSSLATCLFAVVGLGASRNCRSSLAPLDAQWAPVRPVINGAVAPRGRPRPLADWHSTLDARSSRLGRRHAPAAPLARR